MPARAQRGRLRRAGEPVRDILPRPDSHPGDADRNAAKRFINFIDAAYDARAKLVASADAEPDGLAPGLSGGEGFEFQRTASRLMEMRSRDYLGLAHDSDRSDGPGDLGGIVDG